MKSILFIEQLYHLTVSGQKTITRHEGSLKAINDNPNDWEVGEIYKDNTYYFFNENDTTIYKECKPRFTVGEIVYLKEPIAIDPFGAIYYKYDNKYFSNSNKWQNKLFMPEKYARAYIKITGVRVERLFDISDDDCLKEGVESVKQQGRTFYKDYLATRKSDYNPIYRTEKRSFFSLFRFANKIKPETELKNIWVFVYEYEITKN